MKVIKGIFYTLAVLVIALSAFVLLCALNPNLSQSVAKVLYGDENATGIMDIFNKDDDAVDNGLDRDGAANDTDTPDGVVIGDGSTGDGSTGNGSTDSEGNGVIIEIPEENRRNDAADLSKMTGYEPITGEEEKITDDVAESIKKTLSTGETGEKFTFDTSIYPYYGMLTEDEKAVYRQIYANAIAINSSFAPIKAINTSQLSNIFESVVNDHPELFYLETSYSVKYTKSGSVVEIQLSYYTLANALETAKANFSSAAKAVIAGANELDSDYAKEKYVHDYLVQNVTYADGAVLSQSAYSALVNGISVCAGYARANQYILQQLGIPCYYCTGYAGEDHAWNIVKLSDGYYNEDVTWDDTNPSTYDYFNKSDKDFASTHTRTGLSVNLPPCNGTAYSGLEKGNVDDAAAGDPSTVGDSNPTPLRYEDLYPNNTNNNNNTNTNTNTNNNSNGTTTSPSKEELIAALEKLGYKETDAVWSMEEYYADCKKKLVAAGSGDQHFSVIIPASLFKSIESAYGKGEYKTGYVDEALKSLGMNKFSIQIQAERMGGGFYKLYHNVVSWKEETTTETTETTEKTLYNENGIKIVSKGLKDDTSLTNPELVLYVENTSQKDITVSCKDVKVNKNSVDTTLSIEVAASKTATGSLVFSSESLKKSSITEIKDIELVFHITETKSGDTVVDTSTISFSL
ncbi:MAG: hypothetical protein K5669_09200 [Lachnospiraceae bacterium]|nr:hypothetical protein [Lachnospiraceae bacterium]